MQTEAPPPPVMQVDEATEIELEAMALTAMRRRGSIFHGYLAMAWQAADEHDAARLRAAFGPELAFYRRQALGVVS